MLALLLAAWIVAEACLGGTGLLWLSPVLPLAVPLALGRYVGERRLTALATHRTARRRRRPLRLPAPPGRAVAMHRGGRLVACALAKRPPPPGGQRTSFRLS